MYTGLPELSNAPDRLLPAQIASWASEQLLGVIQLKAGVVASLCRSCTRPLDVLSRLEISEDEQSVELDSSDSNHGNGKCLGTYWSLALAEPGLVTPAPDGSPGPPHLLTSWAGPVASALPRSWA